MEKGIPSKNTASSTVRILPGMSAKVLRAAPMGEEIMRLAFQNLSSFGELIDPHGKSSLPKITMRSGIHKLVLVIGRLFENIKCGGMFDETSLYAALEVITGCCECLPSQIDERVFGILVDGVAPLLFDVILNAAINRKVSLQIAETLSLLVESVCKTYGQKPELGPRIEFLVNEDKKCRQMGALIGRCGCFFLQANLIEIIVRTVRSLCFNESRSVAGRLCKRVCFGFAKDGALEPNSATMMSELLMSIAEGSDCDEEGLTGRIRQWLNNANEARAKRGKMQVYRVFSYRVQKVILNNHDKQYPMWVDFNDENLTISAIKASHPDGQIGPLVVFVNLIDIEEAKGRQSSSSVTLLVRRWYDLLHDSTSSLPTKIVLEFTLSDFSAVGLTLKAKGIHYSRCGSSSKPNDAPGMSSAGRCISAVRKASISFSTDLLEQFLCTDPSRMYNTKMTPEVSTLKTSGGMPILHQSMTAGEGMNEATSPDNQKLPYTRQHRNSLKEGLEQKLVQEWNVRCNKLNQDYERLRRQFDMAYDKMIRDHHDLMHNAIREAVRKI